MSKIKTDNAKMLIRWIVSICLALSIMPNLALGIGQTTDPIEIKNALRGKEYQETMIVINTDKTNSTVSFGAQGDVEKWVEFYKFNDYNSKLSEISMAAGEKRNISVIFKIPGDAPNGTYKGFLSVIKKPDGSSKGEGSESSVSQRIDREVTIDISDAEIISFEVSVIPKTYDMKKNENLEIRLIYDNRGNVSIAPQAQVKISKDDKTVYNSIFPYPESEPSVKPGAIYEIPAIQIPTNNFEKGKFRAEMSFLVNGKATLEKSFGFSVDLLNSEDQSGTVLGAKDINMIKGINDINFSLFVIFVILAIVGMIMFFRNKISKKNSVIAETADNDVDIE